MKRVSASLAKKIAVLIFGVLIALTLVSCEYFNLDIKQVLSEKLDTASVEKVEFPSSFVKNRDGICCVPSNLWPLEFSVVVRNPRAYNLGVQYVFDDGTDVEDALVTNYYDSYDRSEDVLYIFDENSGGYSIRFNDDFIKDRELNNRDISGRIILSNADTGILFEPYEVSLRANTPPREIENVMLQLDSTGNYYVLCFEMGDFGGSLTDYNYEHIHDDVHVLNINGTKYYLGPTTFDGNFYLNPTCTEPCTQFSTSDPGIQPLDPNADSFEPSDNGGMVPIYFSTNVPKPSSVTAANEQTWSFFLEDDEGLTTETHKVSNLARKLNPPVVNARSGRFSVNTEGYYRFTVTHDNKCVDGASVGGAMRLYYYCYENGELIDDNEGYNAFIGGDSGNCVIDLRRGHYDRIEVYVKKEGYITSDPFVMEDITILQPADFYVSSDGYDGWTGTVGAPVRTIQYAIYKFEEEYEDETVCNIYLLSDITSGSNAVEGDFVTIPYIECDDGTKTFNIIGWNKDTNTSVKRTIDAQRSESTPGRVMLVEANAKLTLQDVKITGGYAGGEDGGGLFLGSGSDVTLTNCTVTRNTAEWTGGGIAISGENVKLRMSGCSVSDNTSYDNGGGLYVGNSGENALVTISNSTISGNTANNNYGGGMHLWAGTVELTGCTISDNSSSQRGGAISVGSADGGNGVLKLNGSTSIPAGSTSSSVDNGIYLASGLSIRIESSFAYTGSNATIELDNEGYQQGRTILSGVASAVSTASSKFKMANSNYKILESGTLSVNPDLYVSSSASTPAGNDTNGDGSSAHPFATVTKALERIQDLGVGADYVIHVKGVINDSVAVDSLPSGATLKISGSNKGNDKLDGTDKSSLVSIGCAQDVTLENLTICNLTTTSSRAGVYVGLNTNVTIDNCVISGNTNTGSMMSGGVYNAGGTLYLKNSEVSNNEGTMGGGIALDDASTITIENCSITGNTANATRLFGGGLQQGTCDDDGATINIKGKNTITGNRCVYDGNDVVSNVFLYSGSVLNITGALDAASRIGVTTQTDPSPGTNITFTNGVSNSGLTAAQLAAVFFSDKNYVVNAGSTELALGLSGGSYEGGIPSGNLVFAFKDAATGGVDVTNFYAGYTKAVFMTVYEPGEDDPISAADLSNISIKVKCGSREIESCTPTKNGNIVSFTIPNTLLPDNYIIYVTVKYKGVTYDASLALEGRERLVATTPAPSGFVGVLGATVTSAVSDSVVFIDGCRVEIPDMYVCDHEVTQAEYTAVMGSNLSNFDGSSGKEPASGEIQENRPVEKIEWFDAIMYCNLKSEAAGLTACYAVNGNTNTAQWDYTPQSGDTIAGTITCNFNANGYRLPTEAEWEYIARCGNNGTMSADAYSGSNSIGGVAWYKDNSDSKTHEVKKKTANSLGIYDMCGNVWEWCWDVSASASNMRIRRGGYYSQEASYCTVSTSQTEYASMRKEYGGFRVVRTVQ